MTGQIVGEAHLVKRYGLGIAIAPAALLLTFGHADAAALKIVNVGAPAINCVFSNECKVVVTDSLGTVPLAGVSGQPPWPNFGPAVLQSRSYVGAKGSPAAGEMGYMYRMVLTYAVGSGCVTTLKLDVGPIKKHYFDFTGTLADVFVVTSGGLGTIGLSSASQDGNIVTFRFDKPVCAGPAPEKGDTSFFFGFAAGAEPMQTSSKVEVAGQAAADVPARVPRH